MAASLDAATGSKRRYPWGHDPPTPGRANLNWQQMDTAPVDAYPDGDSPSGCRQMIGNVWEWTSTPFGPYPGFVLDPYKEYSEPWFGDHMVLRGGAWPTRSRLIRNTWRNFYRPDRRDVWCGFRTSLCEMKILIVTPAPPGSRAGNNVTARRWAGLLRDLGHRASVAREYARQDVDILIALHARKSAGSVKAFKQEHLDKPVILCLTGTDIYQDLPDSLQARQSIEVAEKLIILQPLAALELPEGQRGKAVTIFQSAEPLRKSPRKSTKTFDVCVSGHLREVKDPFRAAEAAKRMPEQSRIRILHIGGALEPEMAAFAQCQEAESSRYRWLGERPQWEAKRILGRSRLLVVSSRLEGGANVASEAVVLGVPVLASKIPGNIGLLGESYPGYFPVGDTSSLAGLMWRAETDPAFMADLQEYCSNIAPGFSRKRESKAWGTLLKQTKL